MRELPANVPRENLKEAKVIKESVGHIRFWGDFEYLEINGVLLKALWKNGLDPDGIRYGALRLRPFENKEELIQEIEELVVDYDLISYIPDQEKHLYEKK